MSFSMLAKPALGALVLVAAGTLISLVAAADPEAAGPAKAPPEALGNPQAGQFGDPNTGYFGNSAEGSFHNSQFPTVPPSSGGAAAAPAATPKLGQGPSSPYVKLDAPSAENKGSETPTAGHSVSRKKKSHHTRTEPVS